MKCQNCGLENPPTAQRCDCGFDFLSNKIESSYLKVDAKTASTKNLWPYIIVALLVITFSKGVGNFVGKATVDGYYSGKKETAIAADLLKAASEINAKAPMMVDSDTRFDNVVALNMSFRHNFTLVNYSASSGSVKDLSDSLEPMIVHNVCASKDMQVFLKNGVTLFYAYYGNDGKEITVISVIPSQCGGTK